MPGADLEAVGECHNGNDYVDGGRECYNGGGDVRVMVVSQLMVRVVMMVVIVVNGTSDRAIDVVVMEMVW